MWNIDKNSKNDMLFSKDRRHLIKLSIPLGLLLASPIYAKSFLDKLQETVKKEKTQNIIKGAGNVFSSTKDVDYKTEFSIGESLALEGFKRYGMPIPRKKRDIQKFVNLLGNALARNSGRSNIPYYFVIVNSPLYNAFACPGGIVFVSSALVKSLNDEAELACVLAHEIAHVKHKHALQSIKRAKLFEGVGQITAATIKGDKGKKFKNIIGGLQNVLFEKGLDKNMEYEADLSGMEIAYKTGYDPAGLIRVLKMLKKKEQGAQKKGSWFSTHPPLTDRIKRCKRKMAKYPDASTMATLGKRMKLMKKVI